MKKLLTILTIIFVLILPKSVLADSREYFIDNLNIDAQILANVDVVVNEILQYRFQGEFNGIYRNLKLNGTDQYLINSVSIIDSLGNIIEATEGYNEENNTYEINEDYDETQIKLFCKSSNESKKINLNYTIKGAAKKYTDYSELYWSFYNVKNIDSVKEGTLKITLKDTSFSINFILEWFKNYEVRGSFSIEEIKSSLSSSRRAKVFIDNLNYWLIKVRSDGENIGFYTKIRNKNIIENTWYNEKCKWIAYKKYLKNRYKFNDVNNTSLIELTVIYASALQVGKDKLKGIIDSITSNVSENINSFSNTEYIYMNNYLLYLAMFNNIANDALHIANRQRPSIEFNSGSGDSGDSGSSGGNDFFSGGDFTGGGGGDSGAF